MVFPRTVAQAKALDASLRIRDMDVDGVVRLCVDDAVLLGRIEKRFADEGRKDDNPESFKIRLRNYNEQTAPLLPYYAEQGKLSEVDVLADIETVAQSVALVLCTIEKSKAGGKHLILEENFWPQPEVRIIGV